MPDSVLRSLSECIYAGINASFPTYLADAASMLESGYPVGTLPVTYMHKNESFAHLSCLSIRMLMLTCTLTPFSAATKGYGAALCKMHDKDLKIPGVQDCSLDNAPEWCTNPWCYVGLVSPSSVPLPIHLHLETCQEESPMSTGLSCCSILDLTKFDP